MEVKINREIRDYKEAIFFGLNLRQLIFSVLAMGVAVAVYFGLRNVLGTETVSWLCILAAVPLAALGFIKYNGMTAEKFVAAYIRSELLMPKYLCFKSEDIYYCLFRDIVENTGKKKQRLRTAEEKCKSIEEANKGGNGIDY